MPRVHSLARARLAPAVELSPAEVELRADIASMHDDPLAFVMYAFKWGEGELVGQDGPDRWQRKFLLDWGDEIRERGFDGTNGPVMPIRFATASGHGIGKSALVAWVVLFIMATRPYCRGSITASTVTQLQTKTQPELAKWLHRCVCGHWFRLDTTKIVAREAPETWRADFLTSAKENSEAFAGQHNAQSTSFYVIDEGSGVPDVIYEVAEGGLTDGEPMIFVFGNRTQPHGHFNDIFTKLQRRWLSYCIDSREAKMTNKRQIQEWLEDWGEDSDFFRVRVRGLPPSAAPEQFIGLNEVKAARARPAVADIREPLVLGVDVARFGSDRSVIVIRKGNDARTHHARIYSKISTMDLASIVVGLSNEIRADAVFIDGGGVGGGVVDRCRDLGLTNVIEVNFGNSSTDKQYYNKRTEMWGLLRDAIHTRLAIEDSDELQTDLVSQQYQIDPRSRRTRLIGKEDLHRLGELSPDWGDALALTYAYPVARLSETAGGAAGGLAGKHDRHSYHPHDALARAGR